MRTEFAVWLRDAQPHFVHWALPQRPAGERPVLSGREAEEAFRLLEKVTGVAAPVDLRRAKRLLREAEALAGVASALEEALAEFEAEPSLRTAEQLIGAWMAAEELLYGREAALKFYEGRVKPLLVEGGLEGALGRLLRLPNRVAALRRRCAAWLRRARRILGRMKAEEIAERLGEVQALRDKTRPTGLVLQDPARPAAPSISSISSLPVRGRKKPRAQEERERKAQAAAEAKRAKEAKRKARMEARRALKAARLESEPAQQPAPVTEPVAGINSQPEVVGAGVQPQPVRQQEAAVPAAVVAAVAAPRKAQGHVCPVPRVGEGCPDRGKSARGKCAPVSGKGKGSSAQRSPGGRDGANQRGTER